MTASCSRKRGVKKKRKTDTAEKKIEDSKEANTQPPAPSSLGTEKTEIHVPLSILLDAGWRDLSVPYHQLRPQHCLTTGVYRHHLLAAAPLLEVKKRKQHSFFLSVQLAYT